MAASTTPSTASGPAVRVAAGWPLARRLHLGSVRFGGLPMTDAMIAGAEVRSGDRVVQLGTGDGSLERRVRARFPLHAWTVAPGAADATGLPDGSASVVLAEGLLTGLSQARKASVLAEARRLLRPGGLLAFHELCVRESAWDAEPASTVQGALRRPAAGALRPLTDAGWRALLAREDLRVVGTLDGPVEIPTLQDLVRQLGPKGMMAVLPRLMMPGRANTRIRRAVVELTRHRERLAAIVVVAERPVVGALRERPGMAEHTTA